MAFFINSLEMTIELYLSIFSFKYFPFMFLTPALNSALIPQHYYKYNFLST